MSDYWQYSTIHKCACQVIESQTLWGETTCRVWLPGRDSVVRVPAARLAPLEDSGTGTADGIAYVASAARVADALTQDVLLAPIESSVIPLPHQIRALSRALKGGRVRYLLADEVGLGKTIEAGLILRELKLRGLVKRVLVVAPKGLVTQWVAEMRTHFGETFQLVLPEDLKTLRRISPVSGSWSMVSGFRGNQEPGTRNQEPPPPNPWKMFNQAIVPMDSVKPLEKRKGWTAAQVAEYNQERFEDLVSAGWDMVIVDEAHRLGGSTDQVARFKLGQGLSEAAPYFLLLSATPHQGKTDAFHRLLSLIDAQAFPDVGSVTRDRVQPYVIRTEKRRAIDACGKPLFKPRKTELVPVSWGEAHQDQRLLYEAVTEYVREGYNQAIAEKRSYIGFLMILMQRLVVSSTSAIKTTLARRLEVLSSEFRVPGLFDDPETLNQEPETIYDLNGEELRQLFLRVKGLKNEREEVKLLLEAATRCEQAGADAKAEALLDWLYRLQADEGDPELKVLVFTEFVPTQQMLRQFLTERGFPVVCLNGSMDMDERKNVQEAFAEDARILISTDAGGEGLNLQFCHVVINYDIPWNPMRLEQRIGRVDRIGQTHVVRAVNFVFEDSVEHRVREVLEEKLAVIFEEFGIDKTGDVLDSAQAGQIFDDLYVEAILNPDVVETKVDEVLKSIQEQVRESRQSASVLGPAEDLEPSEAQRLMAHPLPHWIETMTTSWLRSRSDELKVMSTEHVEKRPRADAIGKNGPATIWRLVWPDGFVQERSFTHHSLLSPHHSKLGLEESRIRGLAMRLPRFAPGQPISIVTIPGISDEITGLWSLWEISIAIEQNQLGTLNQKLGTRRRRIMPLFVGNGGKIFTPTARHLWDQLLSATPNVHGHLERNESKEAFNRLAEIAEEHGRAIYDELVQEHRTRLTREREKGEYAFAARRRVIERVGLPQVRDHRLTQLQQEERAWSEELERKARVLPDLSPLIVIRVERSR